MLESSLDVHIMDPRLKTSKKWTDFPEELKREIVSTMTQFFSSEYDLCGGEFAVEGRIYLEEIFCLVGLRFKNQLRQKNFELSWDYDSSGKKKVLQLIQESMDVMGYLWGELLEEDLNDSEFPQTWSPISWKDRPYFFRYSSVRTDLERQADELLNQDSGGILQI